MPYLRLSLCSALSAAAFSFAIPGAVYAANYNYFNGEINPNPIVLTESSTFTIGSGSATQGGPITTSNESPFIRDGAGTLTLASWSSLPSATFYDGTTILSSSDGSYFTNFSIDGNFSGSPVVRVAGSLLGSYAFYIGSYGLGELEVTGGGSFEYTNVAVLGYNATGNGRVLVSGPGSVLNATGPQMIVGRLGQGALTLSNGGKITSSNSARSIHLGEQVSGRGVINIGSASGVAPVAPGIVELNQVSGGAGGGTIVFNHTSNNYVFTQNGTATGGVIWVRDGMSFRVEGGTTTLRDANTNTGDTTVVGGTLLISSVASPGSVLGTGALNVGVDGTVGGTGVVKGAATIAGTLSPGTPTSIMTFESGLALESTARIVMEIGGYTRGISYDGINITGALALNGTLSVHLINDFVPQVGDTFTLFSGSYTPSGNFASPIVFSNGYHGSFNPSTGVLSVTAVPEPSSLALLLVGVVAVGFGVCRAKRNRLV